MNTRRQFVLLLSRFLAGLGLAIHPALPFVGRAVEAAQRRLLPKETDLQSLRNEHPTALDTIELEVMPVESFQTMGATDHDHLASVLVSEPAGTAVPAIVSSLV